MAEMVFFICLAAISEMVRMFIRLQYPSKLVWSKLSHRWTTDCQTKTSTAYPRLHAIMRALTLVIGVGIIPSERALVLLQHCCLEGFATCHVGLQPGIGLDGMPFPVFYSMNHMFLKGIFALTYHALVRCEVPRASCKAGCNANLESSESKTLDYGAKDV
eukprot:6238580-Amphidinium_carterae.1